MGGLTDTLKFLTVAGGVLVALNATERLAVSIDEGWVVLGWARAACVGRRLFFFGRRRGNATGRPSEAGTIFDPLSTLLHPPTHFSRPKREAERELERQATLERRRLEAQMEAAAAAASS